MSERRVIYFLLCCACVTISFNVAAISAAIPAISRDLALRDILVSRIIPFYMIPYGLGALMYAPFTRFFPFRKILGISLTFYGCASLFCALAKSLWPLFLGRIGMGLAGASAIPLGLILIGQMFPREVRGRLVGLFFGCSFFASMAGIACSGLVDWRWLFFVPAVMGMATGCAFFFYRSQDVDRIHGVAVNYLQSFRNTRIREIFMFIFVISFLYHGVHKWFGVYLDRIYHLDKFMISAFFMLISISSAFGQILGGHISDKRGRLIACFLGLFLLSVGTMALVGTYPLYILGVVLAVIGMGWTVGHNGISTILTDFPEENRPEIASLNSSVRFVSGGIGFYVSSLFVEKSFSLTFLGIGILMALSIIFLRKIRIY